MFAIRPLLFLFLCFYTAQALPQKNQLLFHQLTSENGLSNNSITCVFKDSRGFVWVGTIDGLNRFDGYSFTIFKHSSNDKHSISDNFVSTVIEDFSGNLWIGTQGGGLNKYDPVLERFTSFYAIKDDSKSLPSNFIFHHKSMLLDKDSVLWIGTDNGLCSFNTANCEIKKIEICNKPQQESDFRDIRIIYEHDANILWLGTNNGLLKFHKKKGLLKVYSNQRNNSNSLSNNIVTSISENKQKNELWVGTEDGLNVIITEVDTIKHFYFSKNNPFSISDNSITSIENDENGNLWIGTKSGGLNKYNAKEGKFEHWISNQNSSNSLSDNYIDNLFYDKKGYLWIGTVNNGINLLDIKPKKFELLKSEPGNNNSLSYNTIRSIFKDREGTLWIGTYGGGLNKFDGTTFSHFYHQPNNINSLGHNIVSTIYEDNNGTIWVGTWGGGICTIDKKRNIIKRLNLPAPHFIGIIAEDYWRNIWIACNGGIYIYQQENNNFYRLDSETEPRKKLTATSVNKIAWDSKGNVWAATFDGLNQIILKKQALPEIDSIVRFKKEVQATNTLTDDRLMCVFEASDGNIWIGTYTGGLNKLEYQAGTASKNKYKISYFTENEGLAGNIVYGILEDNRQNLWMSTNNGISKFNINNSTFQNFNVDDGLQSNQFYWNAYFKSNTGEMYFGGINGLNYFHPDSIVISNNFPSLYITDMLLFNRRLEVDRQTNGDGDEILKQSILFTDDIKLSRRDYPFTFEFAALLYKSQNKVRYAYKMENFDQEWLYTDAKKRYATYSHLRPRTYIFKVKSTNEDGIWNDDEKQIKITVMPAIWETVWAFIVYGIVLIVLLYFFRNHILARARYKHEIQLQKLEREKIEEYNNLKLLFFTNISHEFRTPLTLITGPLEKLLSLDNIGANVKNHLLLIQSGSKRLLHLINQLLDFRKVETGNFELKVSYKNLSPMLQEIAMLFKSKAQSNKIMYSVNLLKLSRNIWIDENVVETIVYNLLSNAFKFTRPGGKIRLNAELLNKNGEKTTSDEEDIYYFLLKVNDTGIGIPLEKQEEIFKRFHQAGQPGDRMKRGTGIGLTLCKDLANLHYGDITVESAPNIGSTFAVRLPVHKSLFGKKNIADPTEYNSPEQTVDNPFINEPDFIVSTEPGSLTFAEPENKKAPRVLIIEDDTELVNFIGKLLEGQYKILFALDGNKGLAMALDEEPDLIISDIMMPEMSGFEVCERIKTDMRMSHIPIILLTALSSVDDKIKGLTTGADDYISKPFDHKHLLVRVEKLIEQRNQLKMHFQKEFNVLPNTPTLPTLDEMLLNKVVAYIEKNIAEPDLGVEQVSNEIGISTTHLYRKIKALTGLSTNEMIRKIRLKKAAALLISKRGTIAQVMNDVGYSNSSYFAKCFQEEFGMTPKEYISRN
jgi:signal transduction histidine kinase/ligand-binding sensor domain-containing protein/CheY-like chemotaxis protein/AraC-like DNA-binding protein